MGAHVAGLAPALVRAGVDVHLITPQPSSPSAPATIAGDMGEADHVTGSSRYHVLFAMALLLLVISFVSNLISEYFVSKSKKKWGR